MHRWRWGSPGLATFTNLARSASTGPSPHEPSSAYFPLSYQKLNARGASCTTELDCENVVTIGIRQQMHVEIVTNIPSSQDKTEPILKGAVICMVSNLSSAARTIMLGQRCWNSQALPQPR
jgi:hypothetical protein